MDGISIACQGTTAALLRTWLVQGTYLGFGLTFRNKIIEVLHHLCIFMGDGKTNIQ